MEPNNSDDSLRCILKKFNCPICNKVFKKLVNAKDTECKCPNCGHEHCQEHVDNEFNREGRDRAYNLNFRALNRQDSQQYHPVTDVFNTSPNNIFGDNERQNINNQFYRFDSSTVYNPQTHTFNTYTSTTTNVNPNMFRAGQQNNQNNQNYQQNQNNQNNQQNQNNQNNIPQFNPFNPFNAFNQFNPFNPFSPSFGMQPNNQNQGMGFQPPRPQAPPQPQPSQPQQNSNQNNSNQRFTDDHPLFLTFIPFSSSPFARSVRRSPFNFSVFESFFPEEGIFENPMESFFFDNFASNFSSNFFDPLTRIVFAQSMQNQHQGNPPASKSILDKLKKFKMSKEYCQKDSQDPNKLEYPSCSICLTDIAEGNDTILLPCGHMFHVDCISKWLGIHNTCPLCRFELPTDDIDYERERNNRNMQRNANIARNPNARTVDFRNMGSMDNHAQEHQPQPQPQPAQQNNNSNNNQGNNMSQSVPLPNSGNANNNNNSEAQNVSSSVNINLQGEDMNI